MMTTTSKKVNKSSLKNAVCLFVLSANFVLGNYTCTVVMLCPWPVSFFVSGSADKTRLGQ